MLPIASEYYPPIELDYLEDLLALTKAQISHLIGGNEIKTKKIGNIVYVSNYSLSSFMDKVPKNREKMEERIIKRKIMEAKEDKVLKYAHYINMMRRSNKEWYKKFIAMKDLEFNDKISFTLNSRIDVGFSFEEISLDLTDEEMNKITSDVKKMNLWVFE